MIVAGIIIVTIVSLFTLFFLLFFVRSYFYRDYVVKEDFLDNGIYIPANKYKNKAIAFYIRNDEGTVKITFHDHVTYAELSVLTWSNREYKVVRTFAVSPNDENQIEIEVKGRLSHITIIANKVNDDKYSSSYPKPNDLNRKFKVLSFVLAGAMILTGVGLMLIMGGVDSRIHQSMGVLSGVLVGSFGLLIGVASYNMLCRKYLPYTMEDHLDD